MNSTSRIFIKVRYFSSSQEFYYLVSENLTIGNFMEEIKNLKQWNHARHVFCLEKGVPLSLEHTFKKNQVIHGDHLIVL